MLHLSSCLLEQLPLLTLVELVLAQLLLFELLLPLFTFFLAAVRARECLELLRIGNSEVMIAFVALERDLLSVESFYDGDAVRSRNLFAIVEELEALVAPVATRGSGILDTEGALRGSKHLHWDEECVVVQALELQCILALTNAVCLRDTLALELLGKRLGLLKDVGLLTQGRR